MSYRSFEDLEVWQRGCRIAIRIYEVLKDCRDYGLKDQMRRAAVSIASNTCPACPVAPEDGTGVDPV